MTHQQAIEKAQEKLQNATVETIKEAIVKMNDDLTIDGNAFSLALAVLETRINEADFVAFCETL